MTNLAALCLGWMVQLQNPNDPALRVRPEVAQSYPATAEEIAEAAEAWPLPGLGVTYTAALLVVTAQEESRFDRGAVGDSGASVGLFQLWRGWHDSSASEALWLMGQSFGVCRKRKSSERLGWYHHGGAGCDHKLALSRHRFWVAHNLTMSYGGVLPQ